VHLLASIAFAIAAPAWANVIYVRATATGANNGTSWADAYANLHTALGAAQAGDQIWVAAGMYRPGNPGVATASFVLPGNVSIFGGFAGAETSVEQRDPVTNVTRLSGDLDASTVNSYHVLRASTVTDGALLDGFEIVDGFANGTGTDRIGAGLLMVGGSLRIASCKFLNNRNYSGVAEAVPAQNGGDGGAIHCSGNAQVDFSNCRFESNMAGSGSYGIFVGAGGDGGAGGAIWADSCQVTLSDCIFIANRSGGGGPGAQNRTAGAGGDGGAIRSRSGTISLARCVFENNRSGSGGYDGMDAPAQRSGGRGGAVFLDSLSAATGVSQCAFTSNFAGNGPLTHGGAVYTSGLTSVTVSDCTFSGNSIGPGDSIGGDGGAIYATGVELDVIRSSFTANAAGSGSVNGPPHNMHGGNGGAIAASNGAVSIEQCEFDQNLAGTSTMGSFGSAFAGSGGAVIIGRGPVVSPPTPFPASIRSSSFTGNRAGTPTNSGTGGAGGAIYVAHATTFEIANCLVANNQAGGGSPPGLGGGTRLNARGTVSNVTLAGNSTLSTSGGGGVWIVGTVALQNCVLWQNSAAGGSAEVQQVSGFNAGDSINFSCVQGLSGVLGGAGNIGVDPLFSNAAGGDFRLSSGSPCIDAADNAAAPIGITLDVNGNSRFVDDPATADTGAGTPPIVDMGAAEFGPCLGDTNADREVDLADLATLLAQFGASGQGLIGDLDVDGDVDLADLALLLSRFGRVCP
jgi:hypothetical protein